MGVRDIDYDFSTQFVHRRSTDIDHASKSLTNHALSSDINAASTIPAARSTRGSSPAADGASAAVASSSHVGRLNTSHHRHGERAWAAQIAGEGARAVQPPGTHARASNDKLVAVMQQPTQRRGGMYPLLVACPRPVAAMASTTVSKAALAMTPRVPNRDSDRDPPPSPPPMPFVVAPTTAADHHAGGTMAPCQTRGCFTNDWFVVSLIIHTAVQLGRSLT